MLPKLDAKFYGTVMKAKNGQVVPDDEWCVFLAKDDAFASILPTYRNLLIDMGADQVQVQAVNGMIDRVMAWRAANPDRCKIPDAAGEKMLDVHAGVAGEAVLGDGDKIKSVGGPPPSGYVLSEDEFVEVSHSMSNVAMAAMGDAINKLQADHRQMQPHETVSILGSAATSIVFRTMRAAAANRQTFRKLIWDHVSALMNAADEEIAGSIKDGWPLIGEPIMAAEARLDQAASAEGLADA